MFRFGSGLVQVGFTFGFSLDSGWVQDQGFTWGSKCVWLVGVQVVFRLGSDWANFRFLVFGHRRLDF